MDVSHGSQTCVTRHIAAGLEARRRCRRLHQSPRRTTVLRNPDHVTIAVADAATAIDFFALLGFRKQHVVTIDGGEPAKYMGMPDMKAQHITLVLEGAEPHFEIQLLEFDPTPGADPSEHPTNLRRRGYN